jgi:hypothetical protein
MEVNQELINRVVASKATKQSWRNKHDSIEWLEANAVNKSLFSDVFSRSKNCGCIDDFFYLLELKLNKQSITQIMEKEFVLKKGKLIMSFGAEVNENSTDEQMILLLKSNKKHADKFAKLPKNWEEIVDNYSAKKVKEVAGTPSKVKKPRAKKADKVVEEVETENVETEDNEVETND